MTFGSGCGQPPAPAWGLGGLLLAVRFFSWEPRA